MHPKSSKTKKNRQRPSTARYQSRTKRKHKARIHSGKPRDEIDNILDLDVSGARRSTLSLAFEDPFNLTPRTRYTINLLGFRQAEYCHWNENYSYKSDDDDHDNDSQQENNETSTSRKTKSNKNVVNPVEKLKEYNFWNNMSDTLSKIQTKRAELIENKQTFDDIQNKQSQNENIMIDELVEKNMQQTTDAHSLRSRQIDRFIKDRTQQLLKQIDLENDIKKDEQKHIEKQQLEQHRQELLFDQRLQERLALEQQRKELDEQRWKQLENSALWHINHEKEQARKKKLRLMHARRARPKNTGCDEELYKQHLKKSRKNFKQSQLKRTQLLSKYEQKSQQHRSLLRSKSNHFRSKNKSRKMTHKQRRNLIQTQRLEKMQKLETKIKNDTLRIDTQKKHKWMETQRIKNENNTKRKETYKLAKTRHEQSLKTFVKNLSESEVRRKEFQNEQKKRMALKREVYNVARENAKQELKHIRKSKQTQSAVLKFKLEANNKRDEKKKLLEKLFLQQRGKREDLQRDLDSEYKTKIDNALQYQNVTEMRILMLEYAKKNREIQAKEMHIITKQALTKVVDKQLGDV